MSKQAEIIRFSKILEVNTHYFLSFCKIATRDQIKNLQEARKNVNWEEKDWIIFTETGDERLEQLASDLINEVEKILFRLYKVFPSLI